MFKKKKILTDHSRLAGGASKWGQASEQRLLQSHDFQEFRSVPRGVQSADVAIVCGLCRRGGDLMSRVFRVVIAVGLLGLLIPESRAGELSAEQQQLLPKLSLETASKTLDFVDK